MTLHVSRYHSWFVDLGYPRLDIMEYASGEWEIIEYQNAPIIPSLTRYLTVLGPMRNVIPTRGFVEKYTKQCDLHRREFWAREEGKTADVEREHAATERHAADHAARAHTAITRNPDLMERIAKNGLQEMDVPAIQKHIPAAKL